MTTHGRVTDRAFLFASLREAGTVLLESSRTDEDNTGQLLFTRPIATLTAHSLEEIPELFRQLDHHRSLGRWAAGYLAYECGYHFEQVVPDHQHTGPLPLIWFGIYEAPLAVEPGLLESDSVPAAPIRNVRFSMDQETYRSRVERIRTYITEGDTYQVNFTGSYHFSFDGDFRELYNSLRRKQHVPYSALLNTGTAQILSFSPELFFRADKDSITVRPMKGTVKRGRTNDEDRQMAEWLANDPKNRSENLMIVDLLRNDIGRLCSAGSVQVPEMYHVERYETVLQMTSTVRGALRPDITSHDLFRALFPCGSVTGAPKIRTMQIIRELEQQDRGVYCGAIGYIAPEGRSVFSVAIRTVTLTGTEGTMGVGSGIVHDSNADAEFEECRLKAAFLLQEEPKFHLLETMLWNGDFVLLDGHLERLRASADYFRIPYDDAAVRTALQDEASRFDTTLRYRIRLLLSRTGLPTVTAAVYTAPLLETAAIADERTDSSDRFLYHKTTHRELYERYRMMAEKKGLADYIFLNERGEVTEGSVTNLFIEAGGKFYTPPLSCGVLPGVFRARILEKDRRASERIITLDDLRNAEAIYLCNSVRGWQKVTLSEE
ncbi:MAG: aminodeoxychorismate synthase component I [Bacteroidetes bacterium]|nr:aminodeoxychorismate synthase component I [Bacteroidota bacterium]